MAASAAPAVPVILSDTVKTFGHFHVFTPFLSFDLAVKQHVASLKSSGTQERLYICKSEPHMRKDGNSYFLVKAYSKVHAYYIAMGHGLFEDRGEHMFMFEGEGVQHKTYEDIISYMERCAAFDDGHNAGPEPIDYVLAHE